MDIKNILRKVDHTNLNKNAVWEDIKSVVDDGIKYETASVCIPPCFVKDAVRYAESRVKICTVIGFPNGYNKTSVKCFEAEEAVKDGADEIDMVINIGLLKEERYDEVSNEINLVKKSCGGKILKVIIETCLLSEDEIIKMCEIISDSDADFIKTSTGFSERGASFHDIEIMKRYIKGKKIKAAGGISSVDDAEKFIALGADRLGTSRIVGAVKESENQ